MQTHMKKKRKIHIIVCSMKGKKDKVGALVNPAVT